MLIKRLYHDIHNYVFWSMLQRSVLPRPLPSQKKANKTIATRQTKISMKRLTDTAVELKFEPKLTSSTQPV